MKTLRFITGRRGSTGNVDYGNFRGRPQPMVPEQHRSCAPERSLIGAVPLLATLALSALALLRLTGTGKAFYYAHVYSNANWLAALLSLVCVMSLACVFLWLKRASAVFPCPDGNDPPGRRSRVFTLVAIFLGLAWVALCLPTTFQGVGDTRLAVHHWIDDSITIDQIMHFLAGNYSVPVYRFTQGWHLFLPTLVSASGLSLILPVDASFVDGFMRLQQLGILFCLIVAAFALCFRMSRSYWFSIAVVLLAYSDLWVFFTAVRGTRLDNLHNLVIVLFFLSACKFYVSGSSRYWVWTLFFAAMAFSLRYSGHLLLPVLCALFMLHCADKSVLNRFPSKTQGSKACLWLFIAGTVCTFILTFFLVNPYHLLGFDDFVSTLKQLTTVYSTSLEFHDLKAAPQPLLTAWWHASVAEETPEVFSKPWPQLIAARSAMLALSAVGVFLAVGRIAARLWRGRSLGRERTIDLLLLVWLASYVAFMLYQFRGRFILRAYMEPIFLVMSYFALVPFLWLYQACLGRPRRALRIAGMAAAAAACGFTFWYSAQTFRNSLGDLAVYRDPDSDAVQVGRFLDDRIPEDQNPPILNTHFAYVPARFTDVTAHNVDVTADFIARHRFEYLIVDEFLFDYLADIDMTGREDLVYPRFNVRYADVTRVYTALKNDRYPGYERVARLGKFSVFQSKDPSRRNPVPWTCAPDKADADILTVTRVQREGWTEYLVEASAAVTRRRFSLVIEGLTRPGRYLVTGSIVFTDPDPEHRLGGARLGVLSDSEGRFLVQESRYGRSQIDFWLRFVFQPESGPVRLVLILGEGPPKRQFSLRSLRLDELVWDGAPSPLSEIPKN